MSTIFSFKIATDTLSKEDLEIIENTKEIIITLTNKRKELGLTQKELAKLSGVKQSAIARLEGFKAVPKLKMIYKLSIYLGLKLTLTNMQETLLLSQE